MGDGEWTLLALFVIIVVLWGWWVLWNLSEPFDVFASEDFDGKQVGPGRSIVTGPR